MQLRSEFKKILALFFAWKVLLVIVTFIAVNFIPLGFEDRFLGGGPANYHLSPEIFSWANFDGEHYLSIAIFGYKELEQAFFPVYPALISFLLQPFSTDFFTLLLSAAFLGIIVSNLTFLLALVLLWDLLRLDYSQKITFWTILLMFVFPTSFYFGAVYSESLFLLLTVASFYSARKKKWWLAGIFGSIASATRVFGILLLPALAWEIWQQRENKYQIFWLLLVPLGLLSYMFYQWQAAGDPLAFYRLQKIVGEQHQSGITLFPQVLFRYLRMLFSVEITNPIYQTLFLEFVTGILFFMLPIYGFFKKMRLSYVFFALIGFLIPSLQGSLSSVPRYVIVFFPSFIAMAIFINSIPRLVKFGVVIISLIWLVVETALFLRSYWVA